MSVGGESPTESRILVVDDEETIRHILANVLQENGCEPREAASAEEALALLPGFAPAVALLDIVLPGKNGLDLMGDIKKMLPDTEVVMMTSHASPESALRAIKEGAYDYLRKPFEDLDEIWITVQRALERRALTLKNRALLQEQEERSATLSANVALAAPPAAGGEVRSYTELLEFFLDLVTREMNVTSAFLMLLDEPTGTLKVAASRGLAAGEPEAAAVKLGEGIPGSVAASGEPFLAFPPRARRGSRRGAAPRPPEGPSASPIALSVAIKTDRKVLGVFCLGPRKSGKAFDAGDAAHLTALGSQLAVAIEGAQRVDQLQKAYESLKAAQARLVFSERLKAIGQMAAGVAHDFNNALSVILARAQLMRKNLDKDQPDKAKLHSDLATIIKTSLKGAQTIRRIQDYTRTRTDTPQAPVDLNAAIRDAVEICRSKWKDEAEARGKRIDIQTDLSGVPNVTGNAHELTQVVENLIFNAVEAMPDGGRITLRTRSRGDAVVVEVSDTGSGMDQATRDRLFEPFFTTKDDGQGLGTSIVFSIIQRHRGEIVVDSTSGRGTTFTITLPPHVSRSGGDSGARMTPPGPARTARVLLVDDEDQVRDAHADALRAEGHEVVVASRGEEALALLAGGVFDLVVTDLSMAGMSGFDVALGVKKIRPAVPVILLTGWALSLSEERTRAAGVDRVLVKPCPLEDFCSAVQEVLRMPARA